MTRVRIASVLLGACFGFLLSWGDFIDPDRIRDTLLLRDPYMREMCATAVAVAFVALWLLMRARVRSLRPERRHVVGAAIFGVGWAVSDVCPGPVAAQIGQGIAWSVPLLAGVGLGILLSLRREEAPAKTQPASRAARAPGPVMPASNPD
ncbi:MAG: hypothetical protein E6G53_14190 [Actinobacteria bacterium]|nr:MAG: hypothetical protein E6G53_14190 [Actinomycetota bacterium]